MANTVARIRKLNQGAWLTCDPSGIRIAAKQRETTREFVVSVGDARSETVKNRVVTLSGSKVARMAAVAANAVRNFDLSRAIEVLEELRGMGEGAR